MHNFAFYCLALLLTIFKNILTSFSFYYLNPSFAELVNMAHSLPFSSDFDKYLQVAYVYCALDTDDSEAVWKTM